MDRDKHCLRFTIDAGMSVSSRVRVSFHVSVLSTLMAFDVIFAAIYHTCGKSPTHTACSLMGDASSVKATLERRPLSPISRAEFLALYSIPYERGRHRTGILFRPLVDSKSHTVRAKTTITPSNLSPHSHLHVPFEHQHAPVRTMMFARHTYIINDLLLLTPSRQGGGTPLQLFVASSSKQREAEE